MTDSLKAIQMVAVLYETIAACPRGIASSILYCAVMERTEGGLRVGVSLTAFEQLIGVMVRSGLITRKAHLLKACPLGK